MLSRKLSFMYLSQKTSTVNSSKTFFPEILSDTNKYARLFISSIPVYLIVVMLFAEKSLCVGEGWWIVQSRCSRKNRVHKHWPKSGWKMREFCDWIGCHVSGGKKYVNEAMNRCGRCEETKQCDQTFQWIDFTRNPCQLIPWAISVWQCSPIWLARNPKVML